MGTIIEDIKLDFDDVLIRPKRSSLLSRKDVNLHRKFQFLNSKQQWYGVPIMAANMDTIGTFEMLKALAKEHMLTCVHKFYDLSDWLKLGPEKEYAIPSVGVNDGDAIKFKEIYYRTPIDFICIDIANGYSQHLVDTVKFYRKAYPELTIIAGNVVTREMVEELLFAGADIIKVGIGPGSACTTRIQTGVGYPQLSAIMECADAAHGLKGHIIADGGCKVPGDVAKAFGAGADFVMLGGMLAGHDESGGELLTKSFKTNEYELVDEQYSGTVEPNWEHKKFKKFYGMSSDTAQEKYYGGVKDYRTSEGRTVLVPYRGPVVNTLREILGGLRSTCTYVGAESIKELNKRTTFIRVNRQYNNVYERK